MKKLLALALSSILFSSCLSAYEDYFKNLTKPLPKKTVKVYYVPSLQEADNVMYYNRDCEAILPIARTTSGDTKIGRLLRETAGRGGNVLVAEVNEKYNMVTYKIYRCFDPYVEKLKAISILTKSYEVR